MGITEIVLIVVVLVMMIFIAARTGDTQRKQELLEAQLSRLEQRETMKELEKRYQQTNQQMQNVMMMTIAGLRTVEPIAPGEFDTRIRKFLEDIVTPGAPEQPEQPSATTLQAIQQQDVAKAIDEAAFERSE